MEGIKEVVMKRMLSLALVLLLALSLFAGCGGNNTQNNTQTGNQTTEGDGGADAGEAEREHVTIRFAQFGNNLDDAEGYENDPIRQAIEDAVNITLEYDTGTEGFDDRMETELYTGAAADLFPTWGESEKIASHIENELVVNIGEIINADPDRYPTLYKIINSDEYKMYNELYTGDPDATYAIYSISAFADPSFSGVSVYNQAILDEVNGGAVPQTVDEFLAYCEAAGSAGYVGWWPRNDKLTTWDEIDYTLAVPQGTSIQEPTVGANMKGVVLSGELGTDSNRSTSILLQTHDSAVVVPLDAVGSSESTWDPETDGEQDSYATAMVGSRTQYDGTTPLISRVVAFGSVDTINSSFLNFAAINNGDYVLNVCNTICDKEAGISLVPKTLGTTSLGISEQQANVIGGCAQFALPIVILIAGGVIWLRRRNR